MNNFKGYVVKKVHTFAMMKPEPLKESFQPRGDLFYIKGCNGAGKSTIPSYMASRDPEAFTVSYANRILLTVCPSFGFLMYGKYDNSKSKGVDSLSDYDEMKLAVELSELPEFVKYDAIFEGVIPATILNTWVEYLNRPTRKLHTAFLNTDIETCLSRIRSRNGGADFNEELVISKFNRIKSHQDRHKTLFPTVPSVIIRSQGVAIEQMVNLFINRQFEVNL